MKFKVGDRVRWKKDIDFSNGHILEILKIENNYITKLQTAGDEKSWTDLPFAAPFEMFEFYERKVGDVWLKEHELYVHDDCKPIPRRVEFEGYLSESLFHSHCENYAMDIALNKNVAGPYIKIDENDYHPDYILTKWKITMEEIIE